MLIPLASFLALFPLELFGPILGELLVLFALLDFMSYP
jgi:hypothetical protein